MERGIHDIPPAQASPNRGQEEQDYQDTHSRTLIEEQNRPWGRSTKGLSRAHTKILKHRARVSRGRLTLQERRFDIRQQTAQLSKLEETFISALEHSSTRRDAGSPHSLSNLLQQVRGCRRKIRSLEDAYNEEDDALAKHEHALDEEELEFYQKYDSGLVPDFADTSPTASRSSSSTRPPQRKERPFPGTTNPLHDYETKIGEANILRERLDELRLEREDLLQEKRDLDSLGQELDPLDLKFLDTFKEIFAQYRADLIAAEGEIKSLEQDAIEKKFLHPSSSYFSATSHLRRPQALDFHALELQDEVALPNHVVERMQIDIRIAESTIVDRANRQVGTASTTSNRPATDIYQWLKELPPPTLKRGFRNARNFGSQENSWIRYCTNWIVGNWKKDDTVDTRKTMQSPRRPQYGQIGKGWVSVELVPKPHPCLDTDLDIPVRAHSMEEFRSPPGVSVDGRTQDLDITSDFPPPNASHSAPFQGMDMGLDDCEARSV